MSEKEKQERTYTFEEVQIIYAKGIEKGWEECKEAYKRAVKELTEEQEECRNAIKGMTEARDDD